MEKYVRKKQIIHFICIFCTEMDSYGFQKLFLDRDPRMGIISPPLFQMTCCNKTCFDLLLPVPIKRGFELYWKPYISAIVRKIKRLHLSFSIIHKQLCYHLIVLSVKSDNPHWEATLSHCLSQFCLEPFG